jgi:hypothetical protein
MKRNNFMSHASSEMAAHPLMLNFNTSHFLRNQSRRQGTTKKMLYGPIILVASRCAAQLVSVRATAAIRIAIRALT